MRDWTIGQSRGICKNDVQNIKVYILQRFCETPDCKVEDILEFKKESKK